MNNQRYTYAGAGFNSFFRRSIDSHSAANLNDASSAVTVNAQELNFDHSQTTGALGSLFRIGRRVVIDGENGRISINDANEQEMVRLGDLGD